MKKMLVIPAALALAMASSAAFALEFNFGGSTGIYNGAQASATVHQSATATGFGKSVGSASNDLVIAQNSPSFSFGSTLKNSFNKATATANVTQTATAGKGSVATNGLQVIQNSPSWTSIAP